MNREAENSTKVDKILGNNSRNTYLQIVNKHRKNYSTLRVI